jgi:lactoylglutathione lyase
MISAVDKININVRDQDAARRFWTETMGFSLVTDEPIGREPSGARWIEVRPPHSAVTLVLYSLTFDASRLGSLSPVLFTCDDIQKTHQELTARGVEFPDLTRQTGDPGAGGPPSPITKATLTAPANAAGTNRAATCQHRSG